MSWMRTSLSCKNTPVWGPLVTSKGTRRSPNCWLYSFSGCLAKTWGVWDNAGLNFFTPSN